LNEKVRSGIGENGNTKKELLGSGHWQSSAFTQTGGRVSVCKLKMRCWFSSCFLATLFLLSDGKRTFRICTASSDWIQSLALAEFIAKV